MQSGYDMLRFPLIALTVFVLPLISCLDAPRDNIYDPENPNKAYFSMNVYELGSFPFEGAVVNLMQENEIIKSDTTDDEGFAFFEEVDPGVYYINTAVNHYKTVEQGPESLWAGSYLENNRMELLTLHFEDDLLGIPSPYRFIAHSGDWAVTEYAEEPQEHSTPHVYQGNDNSLSGNALALCGPETQYFLLSTKLKVISPDNTWSTGVVFRFQDDHNYYALTLSPDTTYCYYLMNGQPNYVRIIERESTVDVWHTIKVERREGELTIRVSINNAVLFSLYDNIFAGGQVGLIVSNNDSPDIVTINFDDVTVDLTWTHLQ
jgi:hypothetical protein